MKPKSRAKNYAEALLNVAKQTEAEKAVKDSLEFVNSALRVSPEFRAFLLSKRIGEAEKAEALKSALGDQCHEIVTEFLGLLRGESLVKFLKLVQIAYETRFAEVMNFLKVTVQVASELPKDQIVWLQSSLETALGKKIEIILNIDPTLVGGIKLRIGNKFLDASIRNRLDNMRLSLVEA